MPTNQIASFSTHNANVSISAPGAGPNGCSFGVFSTLPTDVLDTEWDSGDACNNVLYSTSAHVPTGGAGATARERALLAPIVSGVAALTRQANPVLTPAQVADVLRRSATQTLGTGWNQFTGAGIVNAAAAVALARVYDTTPPSVNLAAVPKLGGIQVDVTGVDGVDAGKTLAGGLTFTIATSRDGVNYPDVEPAAAEVHQLIATSGPTWFLAMVCDANRNCAQSVSGPLSALVPAPVSQPSLKLRVLRTTHGKLKVSVSLARGESVSLGRGGAGKVVVQIESSTGSRWRAFDRIGVTLARP